MDKYIPVISTLLGVALGSGLTYAFNNRRDDKRVKRLKDNLWSELEFVKRVNLDLLGSLVKERKLSENNHPIPNLSLPIDIDWDYLEHLQKELSGYLEKDVRDVVRFIKLYSGTTNSNIEAKNAYYLDGGQNTHEFFHHIGRAIVESSKLNFHLGRAIQNKDNIPFESDLPVEELVLSSVSEAEVEPEVTMVEIEKLFSEIIRNNN
ncbi:hypothetical protein ACVXSW_004643 [Vibrio parahaemolyticus]